MISLISMLMLATVLGSISCAMYQHGKRLELEEELALSRVENALLRHPAARGRLPQWWEDTNE